ncbi:MAG: molybdopterin-dependent oxidoreductase, partial [Thermodesulfobacteria bacterium]|nr:molybdopterin-dependent oxidoreductase [Thermodesulfobacteriota bacterium]
MSLLGPRITWATGETVRPELTFEPERCLGCLACVTACQRPEDPPEIDRLRIEPQEEGRYPFTRLRFKARYCLQCASAPCLSACPHQALYRSKEGIVVVNRKLCQGEGRCVAACPHGVLEVVFGQVQKCDLCLEDLKKGLLPRCVAVCPTGALKINPSKGLKAQRLPEGEERLVHTVCLACNTRCGLRVLLKGNRLLRVDGNPYHPYNKKGSPLPYETPFKESLSVPASTCAKPQMDNDYLHNPYRLKVPLKRCGPRGSGKFAPISWETLIREISEGGKLFSHLGDNRHYPGLKDFLRDDPLDPQAPELGPVRNRVVWLTGRSQPGRKHFIKRFVTKAVGSINHIPHTDICGIGFRMGNFILSDGKAVEFKADPEEARYVIVFGSNFFSALQPGPNAYAARLLERVREGKAKYVIVDPRGHEALAHAHRWLPVRPGKDGALAMGLLRVLLEEELFDRTFLEIPNLTVAQ